MRAIGRSKSEPGIDSNSGGNSEAEGAAREARRKATSELKKKKVSWSIPVDQQVEDWNLGTKEDPKMVKVERQLLGELKEKLAKLFEEYKNVFASDPSELKGVDPAVCQHKIPLVPDARPIRMKRCRMNPNYVKKVN